jgi:predicted MFS family arabinose efflux permease
MFNLKIYKDLSGEVKRTYRYDFFSSIFHGVLMGVLPMAGFIAQKSLNCSNWELAVIKAMPQAALLFTIFWSRIAANRPKMPLVFWPGLLSRAILLLSIWVVASWQFMLVISVSYMLSSVIMPAQNGILRANYPNQNRGEIVGSIQSFMFTIAMVAAYCAGELLDNDLHSYRMIYFVSGALGIISMLLYKRIRVQGEESLKPFNLDLFKEYSFPIFHNLIMRAIGGFATSFKDTFAILGKDKKFRMYMISYFLFGFANLMAQPVYDIFYYRELDVNYVQSALILSTIPQFMIILTTAYWGKMLDRVNILYSRTLFTLGWMVEPLIYLFARQVSYVYAAKVIVGVAMGGSTLVWLLGAMYFAKKKEEVPLYMGVHTTLTGVRGLIAPFLGVYLLNFMSIRMFFIIQAALMLASAIITFAMGKMEE